MQIDVLICRSVHSYFLGLPTLPQMNAHGVFHRKLKKKGFLAPHHSSSFQTTGLYDVNKGK